MARPIWTGTLSFGLLNVPVSLMSGERSVDLHFRMLDSRSNTPVRYERVNAETGEEVPWKEIVKAFEYEKGSYVVLEPEDIKSAASEGREAVEVEAFVDADSIGPEYFEKPYVLVPGKKAEKGYVLFRETLKRTGKIGIARVVIRTREYLSAVMPKGDALMLMLLRYPQELVDVNDYKIPEGAASKHRISPKEMQMAEQLIDSMSSNWNPDDYRDEFRDRLRKVIEKRLKSKGVVTPAIDEEAETPENATTNVVDFMALLQKSLASKKRTPAQKHSSKSARKSGSKKASVAKKPVAKKASATKKTTKRAAARKAS
ncbi:Ku protein [Rhodanobacter sp. MP7CTX1]|jgi:DNA end-binding protein Ku|uniref:non-homologous end joining protein Ku n=1 Tax=Rhodanobacter sp. MP7CTX1 TaxID=2723084 RepID=UPI001611145F|nr:Ku protein [Rhodanobacter sp. MP7CTX1]MBB6186078.1 DNA end-binding protein Ku [Rhodanobacter sp. MP7CTX1]